VKSHRDGIGRGSELLGDLGVVQAFEVTQREDLGAATADLRQRPPELLLKLPAVMLPIGRGPGVVPHVFTGDLQRHAAADVLRLDDIEGGIGRRSS